MNDKTIIKMRDERIALAYSFIRIVSDQSDEEILNRLATRIFFIPVAQIVKVIENDKTCIKLRVKSV